MTRYMPPTDGTDDVPIVRLSEPLATSRDDARFEEAGVPPPIVYHLDPKDYDFVENYHKALSEKLDSSGGKRRGGAVSRAAAQVQLQLEDGELVARAGGAAGGGSAPPAIPIAQVPLEVQPNPSSSSVVVIDRGPGKRAIKRIT